MAHKRGAYMSKIQEQKIVLIESIFSDFHLSFDKNKLFFADLNKLSFESLQKIGKGLSSLKSKKLNEVDINENMR